jgi:23S rRNA pseudouridine2457 synthase
VPYPNILVFNKPFRVLSQFTDQQERATLSDYISDKGYYPAGRLDYDSEGLLLLTNDGQVQHQIANPRHKMPKTYWVQVEGQALPEQLQALRQGVELKDGWTRPARISQLDEQQVATKLWPRVPPIRQRQSIPTCWLSITINEGRNRQVRRMTAAVGLPTLRLVRVAIGHWRLDDLRPGQVRQDQLNLPPQSKRMERSKKPFRSKPKTGNHLPKNK